MHNHCMYTQNDYKFFFAFLQNIRMSTSSIILTIKKSRKMTFTTKIKKYLI